MIPDPGLVSHLPDHWTIDDACVMRNLGITADELRELVAAGILPRPHIVGRSRGWSVWQMRQSLRRAVNFQRMTYE